MPPRRPGHTTTSPGCRDWKRNVGNEGQAPCTPGNKKGRRRGGLFERCGPLSPPTYHISCVLVLLDPDIYQDICPCVDPARYLFASRGSTIWLFQNVLDNCKPLPWSAAGGRHQRITCVGILLLFKAHSNPALTHGNPFIKT